MLILICTYYTFINSVSYSQFRKKIFYQLTTVSLFIHDTSYSMSVNIGLAMARGSVTAPLWSTIVRENRKAKLVTWHWDVTFHNHTPECISRGILKFDFIPWQEVEKLEGVKLTSTSKKKELALEPIYILETVSLRVEFILFGRRNDQHWHSWCNWADQNWYKCRCACCPVLCN